MKKASAIGNAEMNIIDVKLAGFLLGDKMCGVNFPTD